MDDMSMRYQVIEPFNGGTDWEVFACFKNQYDAMMYVDWLNQADPNRDFPYQVI